jgi:hypothetical protein
MMTGLATPASATPTQVQPTGVAVSGSAQPAAPTEAAGCAGYWDITQITMRQANGWHMEIESQQQDGGTQITGRAWKLDFNNPPAFEDDKIWGDVEFSVSWHDGSFGSYNGFIEPDGFTSGEALDKASGATTNWYLTRRADCLV